MSIALMGGKPTSPEKIPLVKPTFYPEDEETIKKIWASAGN